MAAVAQVNFLRMSEAALRQWVEAHAGWANDRDMDDNTPLFVAAMREEGLSMVVWLLDEKGADMNIASSGGSTPLHIASLPNIVAALLNRGVDPTRLRPWEGVNPLMFHALRGFADVLARLLQWVRQERPDRHAIIALLEQAPNTEKAWLLVKALRLAVVANSDAVALSCLQGRVERGRPSPHVTLMPLMGNGQTESKDKKGGEGRRLQAP